MNNALPRTQERISVSVPARTWCWSEAQEKEQTPANTQTAIREYLAKLEDRFR